jgi:hypothetical protein
MTMPTRTIPVLSVSASILLVAYLALVVTTVVFASWQTQAASSIRDAEASIGMLESQYYASVAQLDSTDPATLGFVHPTNVQYVASAGVPHGLTFAGR